TPHRLSSLSGREPGGDGAGGARGCVARARAAKYSGNERRRAQLAAQAVLRSRPRAHLVPAASHSRRARPPPVARPLMTKARSKRTQRSPTVTRLEAGDLHLFNEGTHTQLYDRL